MSCVEDRGPLLIDEPSNETLPQCESPLTGKMVNQDNKDDGLALSGCFCNDSPLIPSVTRLFGTAIVITNLNARVTGVTIGKLVKALVRLVSRAVKLAADDSLKNCSVEYEAAEQAQHAIDAVYSLSPRVFESVAVS